MTSVVLKAKIESVRSTEIEILWFHPTEKNKRKKPRRFLHWHPIAQIHAAPDDLVSGLEINVRVDLGKKAILKAWFGDEPVTEKADEPLVVGSKAVGPPPATASGGTSEDPAVESMRRLKNTRAKFSLMHQEGRNAQPFKVTGTAPYNFVRWAAYDSTVSQYPLTDVRYSGALELKITAKTPLLVSAGGGDERRKEEGPPPLRSFRFLKSRGKHAFVIPGSSFKGMFRSTFEMLTHSAPPMENTRSMPYRELRDQTRYHSLTVENVATEQQNRSKERHYRAKAKAGFLVFAGKAASIVPCKYSRVKHGDIKKADPDISFPAHGDSAKVVYDRIKSVKIRCIAEPEKSHPMGKANSKMYQVFSQAVPSREGTDGWLVCSGPMNTKKSESFFHSVDEKGTLKVDREVVQDFEEMLSRDQRDYYDYLKKNATKLGFWKGAVPVYYLASKNPDGSEAVEHFGLSMLFRIPTYQAPGNVWKEYFQNAPNLAAEVFGSPSQAGRVYFSHGVAEHAEESTEQHFILGQPHPTCVAHYLFPHPKDRTTPRGQKEANVLLGWNAERPIPRGWKRYWHKPEAAPKPLDLEDTEDQKKLRVASHLKPLKPGAVFTTSIEFHDLTPVELGALLYAINPGADHNAPAYHKLGMGKAIGWGSVKVKVTAFDAWTPQKRYASIAARFAKEAPQPEISIADARHAFEDRLKQLFPNGTPHLDDLRHMMDYQHAKNANDWNKRTRPLTLGEFKPKALLSSVQAVYEGREGV